MSLIFLRFRPCKRMGTLVCQNPRLEEGGAGVEKECMEDLRIPHSGRYIFNWASREEPIITLPRLPYFLDVRRSQSERLSPVLCLRLPPWQMKVVKSEGV
jgi:hypothetical protein